MPNPKGYRFAVASLRSYSAIPGLPVDRKIARFLHLLSDLLVAASVLA